MVKLWVWRIQHEMNVIEDVPERYRKQVEAELLAT